MEQREVLTVHALSVLSCSDIFPSMIFSSERRRETGMNTPESQTLLVLLLKREKGSAIMRNVLINHRFHGNNLSEHVYLHCPTKYKLVYRYKLHSSEGQVQTCLRL